MAVLKCGAIIRQYAIIIIANFTVLNLGVSVAWLSPALLYLSSPNQTVLPRPLSVVEGAWFMSICSLVACSSIFFVGSIADCLGRKKSLILAVLLRIISCVIFLFKTPFWLMLLSRGLCGISDFCSLQLATMYFSEIASKEIRGALGTISQIVSSIGTTMMLCCGPFVSYTTLNFIHLAIVIGFAIPLLFIPESPYFLFIKGKTEEAVKVLTNLRGSELLAHEEIKEYTSANNDKVTYRDILKDKVIIKTLAKAIILGLGLQLTGGNSVFMYLQTVYETTHTNLNSGVSAAITGLIQFLACLSTMFTVDKFGRKLILTSSLLGLSIGMCGLATFFKLTEKSEATGFLNYLPLISIILVIFCYNAGFASLVWVVVAELFDSHYRGSCMTISIFSSIIALFIMTRFFPTAVSSVGPVATYFTFAALSFAMIIFLILFIPETKGKAYSDIQKDLGRNMKINGIDVDYNQTNNDPIKKVVK